MERKADEQGQVVANRSKGMLSVVKSPSERVTSDFLNFIRAGHPDLTILYDGHSHRFSVWEVPSGKEPRIIYAGNVLCNRDIAAIARMDKMHSGISPQQECLEIEDRTRKSRDREFNDKATDAAKDIVKAAKGGFGPKLAWNGHA